MSKDILVGVNYFAGWWREQPNKWTTSGRDWRIAFPERVPVLGCYNDQETMDAEIVTAAEHGVDFFPILWYYPDPKGEREPHAYQLNNGLDRMLNSKQASRMRFYIEFCNHPPFQVTTEEDWLNCCRVWVATMKHPSYLRIEGKAVFKVYHERFFLAQHNSDLEWAQRDLETLRTMAREQGVGELLIGAGGEVSGPHPSQGSELLEFYATYMAVPDLPQADRSYPYEVLLEMAQNIWQVYGEHTSTYYVPYLPAGWDPTPWSDRRASFGMPSTAQWESALRAVKSAFDRFPNLGLPAANGRQKAFTIYAWNEFGEGGIVAPTVGEQFAKLEAIRKVFGAGINT